MRPSAQTIDKANTTDPTIYLDQGWGPAERARFYRTSQGSRLLPYRWFLALERPGSRELFHAPENMRRLRFVAEAIHDPLGNPDDLPIGFVKDNGPASPPPDPSVIKALIDPGYNPETYPKTTEWLGFTCAACHTTRLDVAGKTLRVDGGPAMVDMQSFLEEMNASVQATLGDDTRKDRFARRVLGDLAVADARTTLLSELAAYAKLLDALIKRNAVPDDRRYGHARLDAFGAIFNQVCNYGLGIVENRRPSDAPVSYPPLWNTPSFDWLQTNASAGTPIGRNFGEVIGVYADFRLTPTEPREMFRSSGRLDALFALEEWLKTLEEPRWPVELGGGFALDRTKVAAGAKLFKANCEACHSLAGPDGRFPQNDAFKRRPDIDLVRTTIVPLSQIGTDPRFIENFGLGAKPGPFADFLKPGADGQVARASILGLSVAKMIERKILEEGFAKDSPEFDARQAQLNSFHNAPANPPLGGQGYKARPLNGVWATAPYLHNGSVPNLFELLKPADRRVKSFHVGSWQFDPKHVGFETAPGEGTTELKTVDVPGNSNAGHSGPNFTQTADGRGKFRDFTEEERWALVEFMKTIRRVGGPSNVAGQGPPQTRFDVNDLSFLWPAPETEADVLSLISADSAADGKAGLWPEAAFNRILDLLTGDSATIKHPGGATRKIGLLPEFRDRHNWKIVAFRADPGAPGGHQDILTAFGASPQLRLIVQPVTVVAGKPKVHDFTAHVVYTFIKPPPPGTPGPQPGFLPVAVPDQDKFRSILDDLARLKAMLKAEGIDTQGVPLGVHPGLKRDPATASFVREVEAFLKKQVDDKDLSAIAFMGLVANAPEPWIFFAGSRLPDGSFGPAPIQALGFKSAQMLTFADGPPSVFPVPLPTNRDPISNFVATPIPQRRGVATSALFAPDVAPGSPRLDEPAVIGESGGTPIVDTSTPPLRNRDIPDLIANPRMAHFFSTDCISCHSETTRRAILKIPGTSPIAYERPAGISGVDPAALAAEKYNVRNFGWFPLTNGVKPTVTMRTANETSDCVEFVNRVYFGNGR
ncbi:MAG TPA: di-heme-cytochrome C peroxidase [Isosphaeraceae bacterium]